jgi:predicted metal-binding protein
MINELKKQLETSKFHSESLTLIDFQLSNLEFFEYVKVKCFHCKKYNGCWTCPPRMNHINYEKFFGEYKNAILIRYTKNTNSQEEYNQVRIDSTNILHRALLYLEKYLFTLDNYKAMSFIGGSCKLCKNGCAEDKCRDPYNARVPLEATGVDLIKSFKKAGINISFEKDFTFAQMNRYGLLVW